MSDPAALLAALGCASLPSMALEVYRTVRARSRERLEAGESLRRAPLLDASFVVSAAKEATDLQVAVMDRLVTRIAAQDAEISRLQADNDRLWQRIRTAGA